MIKILQATSKCKLQTLVGKFMKGKKLINIETDTKNYMQAYGMETLYFATIEYEEAI